MKTLFVAVAALLAASMPALADTVGKTWVSSTGTDTGSCQLVAPCKTFAYAITQTTANGEIDVKDSGAYGPFIIDRPVTVAAEGVLATVGSTQYGTSIVINAGNYGNITLRGLTIDGHRSGSIGIDWQSGGSLSIEGCAIRNFINYGIQIKPSADTRYAIIDTTLEGVNYLGITTNSNGHSLKGAIDNLRATFNNASIAIIGDVLTISRSIISNNNVGVISGQNSTVAIGRSQFSNNIQYGVLSQNGGLLYSFGDNEFWGDVAESSLTPTAPR